MSLLAALRVPRDLTPRLEAAIDRLARFEPLAYAVWAAGWTLSSGRTFYGYMMKQTGGEWSAPLDDVFIHFDYARATAQGHPFEWVAGNGYSSGNTSASYPFVLALGYLAGFRRERLMQWAALVAATSVFGALLAARRIFTQLAPEAGPRTDLTVLAARAGSYVLPPLFFAVGALDWTLWSGMEVAFFLATWGASLLAYLALVEAPLGVTGHQRTHTAAVALGGLGALMVLTRPEAVTTLGGFVLGALVTRRRDGKREAALLAARALAPAAAVLGALAALNRALTGEWSANGAIVKLAIYNPFMSPEAKWGDYVFNFQYEIFRNLEYHFTDAPMFGCILPALALAAVAVKSTRAIALVLWAQIAGWALLVALNGQVRWQNERYTMPAVAWLTIAAALGVSALVRRAGRPAIPLAALVGVFVVQAVIAARLPEARPTEFVGWAMSAAVGGALVAALWLWPTRVVTVAVALGLFHAHQTSKMRDQKWFFGRACRNIRDQHIKTGRWLEGVGPRRILVGDAGALIYASGRPGLDIIGLGGYHALPFARAGVQGLTATIELMEHLAPEELPDILAIYPSWWGILPTWFGSGVVARVPAVGNVICGGYEDVVYVADWHLLRSGEETHSVPAGLSVRDTVDVADLVSEREHSYRFAAPASGFTELKVLPDPVELGRDVLDGGRELKPGTTESMRVSGLEPGREAVLIFRSAPVDPATIHVRVNGEALPELALDHTDGWVEPVVAVPARLVGRSLDVEVENDGPGDFVDYHVWAAQ